MTMGEQWAWKPDDKLKSTEECIHTLARTIGGDGNLLFNVGPMPDGRIEPRQVDRLKEMGQWVSRNQEAVYGTRGGPYLPSQEVVSTHKEKKIFLFLLEKPGEELNFTLKKEIKVKKAYFLGEKIKVKVKRQNESVSLSLPVNLPDDIAPVIVLELNKSASEMEPREL